MTGTGMAVALIGPIAVRVSAWCIQVGSPYWHAFLRVGDHLRGQFVVVMLELVRGPTGGGGPGLGCVVLGECLSACLVGDGFARVRRS